MKLTNILYGIILCFAIENGKYYSLAAEGEAEKVKLEGEELTVDDKSGLQNGDGKGPVVPIVVPTTDSSATPGASGDAAVNTGNGTPEGETKPAVPTTDSGKGTPGGEGNPAVSKPNTGDAKSEGEIKPAVSTTDTGTSTSQDGVKPQGSTTSAAKISTDTTTTSSILGPVVSPGNLPIKPTSEVNLKGNDKDQKIVKDGCNFYDKLDLGVKPFAEIKGDKTVCSVKLSEEFDAFLYACDGTSDPPKCPSEVKTEEGVVKIETLFAQATVTDQSEKFPSKPNVFHVITGKANGPFSASCVCSKKDGTKETMELTSSFKQVGILGILGLLVVYLMN